MAIVAFCALIAEFSYATSCNNLFEKQQIANYEEINTSLDRADSLHRMTSKSGLQYKIGRNFLVYISLFFNKWKKFESDFTSLPKEAHWIDMGAGMGLAMEQLAKKSIDGKPYIQLAHMTAVAITKPAGAKEHIDGKIFRYLSGRYIEDIPTKEIGTAEIITDIFGPMTYTARIDLVLKKYLEILKKDGVAWIYFNSDKVTVNDQIDGLGNYLNTIKGIEFEWITPTSRNEGVGLRIKKVSSETQVPTLALVQYRLVDPYREGIIPNRKYRSTLGPPL